MGINVKCVVPVYEVDRSDKFADTDKCKLSIESHWRDDKRVNIVISDGRSLTVIGYDLIQAVKNAMNMG